MTKHSMVHTSTNLSSPTLTSQSNVNGELRRRYSSVNTVTLRCHCKLDERLLRLPVTYCPMRRGCTALATPAGQSSPWIGYHFGLKFCHPTLGGADPEILLRKSCAPSKTCTCMYP